MCIVIAASFIHTSALFFIFAYFLYNDYNLSNNKTLMIGIILILILILFKNSMIFIANLLFGAENRYSEQLQNSEFAGITIAAVYFAFTLFQMYFSKNDNRYITIVMFLTIIQATGMYSQTIPRLAYYFIPLFSLSFPHVLNNIQKPKRQIFQFLIIIIFLSFFFMQASSHYLSVTPFKFFWE